MYFLIFSFVFLMKQNMNIRNHTTQRPWLGEGRLGLAVRYAV